MILGAATFIIIGIFHPIVVKCEYYFSAKIWPVFLVGGLILCGISLLVQNVIFSSILAIIGFSMLWSIMELKHQETRVKKGWFPANPNRKTK